MRTRHAFSTALKGIALAGVTTLALTAAGGALAQSSVGQPRLGGPPGAGQPAVGAPAGVGAPTSFPGFAGPQLTAAQKLVMSLPAPAPGAGGDRPPLDPAAPMPSADPRNFEGAWAHGQLMVPRNQRDAYANLVPFTDEGAKVLARRVNGEIKGTPYLNASAICRPPGFGFQFDIHRTFHIFQTKDSVEFVFDEFHGRWMVAYDDKFLPPGKPYMGRSVAHWEGNTLVVETKDFKQDTWVDLEGTPLSVKGKLIQRIRKVDNGDRLPYLEIINTIDDPINYTQPWSTVRIFWWVPQRAMFDGYDCEEQVGDPSGSPDAGLVHEPSQ